MAPTCKLQAVENSTGTWALLKRRVTALMSSARELVQEQAQQQQLEAEALQDIAAPLPSDPPNGPLPRSPHPAQAAHNAAVASAPDGAGGACVGVYSVQQRADDVTPQAEPHSGHWAGRRQSRGTAGNSDEHHSDTPSSQDSLAAAAAMGVQARNG